MGKTFLVRALLGQDVERDPADSASRTPLLDAAIPGYPEVVRELLRGGADVGKAESNGWTALHFVADDGDQTTLHELLLHPPTRDVIDRRSRDGWTPLMLAARKGHAAIARRLLDRGADRRLLLRDGRDALALAIKSLSAATVREILAPPRISPFQPSPREAS
jgi:ankyrin repeat protein